MSTAVLTINAGSSSIKFALFRLENQQVELKPELSKTPSIVGQIDGLGTAEVRLRAKDSAGQVLTAQELASGAQHSVAFDQLLSWLLAQIQGLKLLAVGHRVVHGGEHFSAPTRLDAKSTKQLEALIPLAPLHQPHNLAGIHALQQLLPDVPQIACFDTAFHRTQPEIAQRFGLPKALSERGIKRYGFHGLSYEYIAAELPKLSPRAEGRVIVAHLGNGASMAALQARQCVATTLGFSTIDGLIMGTRCGALDPGVVLHLLEQEGLSVKEVNRILYKESGLLGISGISQDMRTLLASDHPDAKLAVDLFCYRLIREIGSLAAALGGVDALVFTGGIGEHAAPIRAQVCKALTWLGLSFNEELNQAHALRISEAESRVDIMVIPTNEEWMIANHCVTLLGE